MFDLLTSLHLTCLHSSGRALKFNERSELVQRCVPHIVPHRKDGTGCDIQLDVSSCQLTMFLQLVVEPSGAVGLAAALTDTFRNHSRFQGKRIGIVLCGGNVDLSALGLWKQLRSAVEQL